MIKELNDIEALQQTPGLYVGSVDNPQTLFNEIFDNAKDEALNGYATNIDIFNIKDDMDNYWYIVRDNGRGIPLTSPGIEGDVPIRICTKLHSGGKFDKDIYEFSSGLHGCGNVAVNALSLMMVLTTKYDDTHHIQYTFQNGNFINKNIIDLQPYSTEVKFTPNSKYFYKNYCDESLIKETILVAKYALGDNVSIFYNNEKIDNNYLENFKSNTTECISSNYKLLSTNETCEIYIGYCEDLDYGKVSKGIVNLLVSNEGTHINVCNNLLKNKLLELAIKNKKHVVANDLLMPLKVLCNVKLKNPHFPAQVKGKLEVHPSTIQPLIEPVIDNLIKEHKEFFNKVIDKAEEYRVNLEASKNARKSKSFSKSVKVEGLKDCISKKPELNTLYIVEGLSAGGNIVQCRNPQYDAILPLRGKLLNVVSKKATKSKILDNQVINNIANALGYKLFGVIDPSKCRYGKVMIESDADQDGNL